MELAAARILRRIINQYNPCSRTARRRRRRYSAILWLHRPL